MFQSTLPRGERHNHTKNHHAHAQFQSTLPRGERQRARLKQVRKNLFQSTLPRGERPFVVFTIAKLR